MPMTLAVALSSPLVLTLALLVCRVLQVAQVFPLGLLVLLAAIQHLLPRLLRRLIRRTHRSIRCSAQRRILEAVLRRISTSPRQTPQLMLVTH